MEAELHPSKLSLAQCMEVKAVQDQLWFVYFFITYSQIQIKKIILNIGLYLQGSPICLQQPGAAISSCDASWLGGVLLVIDSTSHLYMYKLPQPALDTGI